MIRKASIKEIDSVLEIYEYAKRFMDEHGNEKQWSGNNAVTKDKVEAMLKNEQLYVGEDNGRIEFVFAYVLGGDSVYDVIENGSWLNDEPYAAIHRVASAGRTRGVVKTITDWALERNNNLRIDTHHDNYVMQNALEKAGFIRCGIVHIENGDERIAYQRER